MMIHQALVSLLITLAGIAHLVGANYSLDLGDYGQIRADRLGIRTLCALEFDLRNFYYHHMMDDNEQEIFQDIHKIAAIRRNHHYPCNHHTIKFFGPPQVAYKWKSILPVFERKCSSETKGRVYCEESSELLRELYDPVKAIEYGNLLCNYYKIKSSSRTIFGAEHIIPDCAKDTILQSAEEARELMKSKGGIEQIIANIREEYPKDGAQSWLKDVAQVRKRIATMRLYVIDIRIRQMTLKGRLSGRFANDDYFTTLLTTPENVCDSLQNEDSTEKCKVLNEQVRWLENEINEHWTRARALLAGF